MTERASLQVGLKPGIARYQQASHKVEMGRNWSSWVGRGGGGLLHVLQAECGVLKSKEQDSQL